MWDGSGGLGGGTHWSVLMTFEGSSLLLNPNFQSQSMFEALRCILNCVSFSLGHIADTQRNIHTILLHINTFNS